MLIDIENKRAINLGNKAIGKEAFNHKILYGHVYLCQ